MQTRDVSRMFAKEKRSASFGEIEQLAQLDLTLNNHFQLTETTAAVATTNESERKMSLRMNKPET